MWGSKVVLFRLVENWVKCEPGTGCEVRSVRILRCALGLVLGRKVLWFELYLGSGFRWRCLVFWRFSRVAFVS